MGILRVTLVVAGVALFGSGCQSLDCEPGTIEVGGECIVETPISCGEGTFLTGGQCISFGVTGCGRGAFLDGNTCVPVIGLSGNAGRLVELQITAPALLGDLFALDLDGYSTGEILMFVGIHDPLRTTPRLYGGRGVLRPPLIYVLDRAEGFATTATILDRVLDSDPAAFELPLTIDDSLELVAATVFNAAVVKPDNRVPIIERGEISGVITPDAADRLVVNGFALRTLFESTNTEPDVDYDEDGTAESWRFTGSFEAEPVWVF